jgi:peptidoglycan hydrolase-like protein with peptidoglycan-binding domain
VGIERDLSSPLPWRRSQRAAQQRRATQARRRRRAFRGRAGVGCALIAMAFATAGALAQESPPSGSGGATANGKSGSSDDASSGVSVSAIQRALGLPADGVYGRRTRAAVKRFQRRKGLEVDGIAGPATLAALGLKEGDSGDGGDSGDESGSGDATGTGENTGATGDGGRTDTSAGATGTQPVSGQAPSGDAAATLERIAQCESGGNPTAVSADGQYRGKYQFDQATWERIGGTGDPAKAGEAEQDRLAAKLLAQRGTAPWPVCGGA